MLIIYGLKGNALKIYDDAIIIDRNNKDSAGAYIGRANCLYDLMDNIPKEAIIDILPCYDKGLSLNPNNHYKNVAINGIKIILDMETEFNNKIYQILCYKKS